MNARVKVGTPTVLSTEDWTRWIARCRVRIARLDERIARANDGGRDSVQRDLERERARIAHYLEIYEAEVTV